MNWQTEGVNSIYRSVKFGENWKYSRESFAFFWIAQHGTSQKKNSPRSPFEYAWNSQPRAHARNSASDLMFTQIERTLNESELNLELFAKRDKVSTKNWLSTCCEVEFFEISSKCFSIASTILVVRVALGADERADNGGYDRMHASPFLPNLWNKFFKCSYSRPLPAIFSALFCFTGLSWWPGWYNFPLKDKSRLWRSLRYFISSAGSFTEINELLFTIISFERASVEENKILRRAETSSRTSRASKVS